MKKLILTALIVCTHQTYAMQMGDAKTKSSKSSTNTCGNAVKTCCYLTAMCGLLTSARADIVEPRWKAIPPQYRYTLDKHRECTDLFETQANDDEGLRVITTLQEGFWNKLWYTDHAPAWAIEAKNEIQTRNEQRTLCRKILRHQEKCEAETREDYTELNGRLMGMEIHDRAFMSTESARLQRKSNACYASFKYEVEEPIEEEKKQ